MATNTKKRSAPAEVATPTVPAETGIKLMQKLIDEAEALLQKPQVTGNDDEAWNNIARDYLQRAFGRNSHNVNSVIYARGEGGIYGGMDDHEFERYLRSGVPAKITLLRACIKQLETDVELQVAQAPAPERSRASASRKVFVVHGHNQGTKETVARFLEKLALEPVVLHEKPNGGRTIIEKFTDYADVAFAVVLLTGDDEGRPYEQGGEFRRRARQNVILELGYFLGRLGRNRVCALYEDGVEIPSDYQGVLFVQLDSAERWRFDLVREMREAGIEVDANMIFA